MSNAHASSTPHHVGQVAKAEILVTDILEGWESPQAAIRAGQLVAAFQELGWTAPRDLTEKPPLTGAGTPPDSPGRREFAAARAELAARKNTPATRRTTLA